MRSESSRYSRYFTYIKPVTKMPIIKTYGSTIFTLIIMAIFIIFAIRPTIATILVLQKKLVDSKAVLEKLNQKANDLGLAKQNYNSLNETALFKISKAIPNTPELKSITQTLENTALKYNASISALQIQPQVFETKKEDTLGAISNISFIFNATGEYQNLISVLQDLKESSRLFSIDKLSLSRLSEGEGLIMSISGKAYFLK